MLFAQSTNELYFLKCFFALLILILCHFCHLLLLVLASSKGFCSLLCRYSAPTILESLLLGTGLTCGNLAE